ncbi:hypothetical protein [Rhizobium leguminosarum]|uniref:hypothetical protein n=1 Tax=Rhizobium leguminosarum TaxID=384 RepID=UPI0012FCC40C|nr:hypothetical protein [Rhizobium leguminosarum]
MSFWQIAGIGIVLAIFLFAFHRVFSDPRGPRRNAKELPPPSPYGWNSPPHHDSSQEREWLPGAGPKDQVVSIIDDPKDEASVSRLFANIFALSADRGEATIASIMTRVGCGRTEAMRIAIAERQKDERRWD